MLDASLPSPTPVAMVTAAALVMAGCTGDDAADDATTPPDASPTATATAMPTTTPTTTPAPSPTGQPTTTTSPAPVVDVPELDARCTLEPEQPQVDTVQYAVPSSWQVDGSCAVLDPELGDLPEAQEVEAALFVGASDVSFSEVVGDSPATEDVETWLGARAGLQLVRQTSVSTGAAMQSDGQPTTSWALDLDPGADDDGGVVTWSTGPVEREAYALAQATLDAVAQTVVVQPAAADEVSDGFTVVRVEGGGAPYAVTHDGDCFALRPGGPDDEATAELCDLAPGGGELVAGVLGDDVLVGHAPATAIGVEAVGGTSPHALTASVEGGSLFAVRVAEVPEELRAIGRGGTELVTAPVG